MTTVTAEHICFDNRAFRIGCTGSEEKPYFNKMSHEESELWTTLISYLQFLRNKSECLGLVCLGQKQRLYEAVHCRGRGFQAPFETPL